MRHQVRMSLHATPTGPGAPDADEGLAGGGALFDDPRLGVESRGGGQASLPTECWRVQQTSRATAPWWSRLVPMPWPPGEVDARRGMIGTPYKPRAVLFVSTDSRIISRRPDARGVAGDEVRRHNLGTVLERLHLSGGESRSDLVAATGLNRSTIGDLVGQLTDLGLVEETSDPSASGPGRPSPLVRTRPQGATVLAVELAVDSVAVATVGLGGHVYNRLRVDRPRGHRTPDETVLDVSRLAGPLLDALPARETLAGVGVAVVGITRRADGLVHLAPNLGWRDVPLGEMFAAELALGVPVMVANEADLGAWGEYRRGGHRRATSSTCPVRSGSASAPSSTASPSSALPDTPVKPDTC